MHKMLKLKAALGGAVSCALAAQGATAQAPNDQLMTGDLRQTFSVADIGAMMGELGVATAVQPYEGDATATFLAETPGGARFFISLFQCENPAEGLGCEAAVMFTGHSNAGVTYDELNDFHSLANVTRVVNVSEQNIIIFGTQIFFSGGVGRENFKYVVQLFLSDMQIYVDSKAAAGTAVSLDKAPPVRGKIDNVTKAGDQGVQQNAFPARYNLNHALNAAVSNTWDVRFSPQMD